MDEKLDDKKYIVPSFTGLVLCSERASRVSVYVSADVTDGCLRISGQDFGSAPMEAFGDSEYEYFYDFDQENTEHLFRLLAPEGQDIRDVLEQRFSGMDGCSALTDFSDANGIKYSFFSC